MRGPRGIERLWLPAAAVFLALCACAKAPAPASQEAHPETSFAAATHADGRSPLESSLATGSALYGRYCAVCHGDTGGGDGFNAYNLQDAFGVGPTAFSDPAQMASLEDAELTTAIRDGGPGVGKSAAMPAWGETLTPGEVADVRQYLRSLATTAQNP